MNFELLAKLHENHFQGVGGAAGLHPSMPTEQNLKLVSALNFL
jgi:hypothetical protein